MSMSIAKGQADDVKSDLCVAFDGKWQKWGRTSLRAVIINRDTGTVLGFESLNKYCHTCKIEKNHQKCQANHVSEIQWISRSRWCGKAV